VAETITDDETGFLFPNRPPSHCSAASAFSTFKANDRLDAMRRRAMTRPFSLDLSAACYGAL
jgi:starch synthase